MDSMKKCNARIQKRIRNNERTNLWELFQSRCESMGSVTDHQLSASDWHQIMLPGFSESQFGVFGSESDTTGLESSWLFVIVAGVEEVG